MTDNGPITREELVAYPQALGALASIATSFSTIAQTLDVSRLRQIATYVETVAPIQEPTAYVQGGMDNVAMQQRFLEAVQDFLTALEKIK